MNKLEYGKKFLQHRALSGYAGKNGPGKNYKFDIVFVAPDVLSAPKVSRHLVKAYSVNGFLVNMLISYHQFITNKKAEEVFEGKFGFPILSFMLDSGAYSARKLGDSIDVGDYISFAKEWREVFDRIVGLDIIGNSAQTLKNVDRMSNALGFPVMPVHHMGESFKHLDEFVEHFGQHGVGLSASMKPRTHIQKETYEYYVECFRRHPTASYHLFGILNKKLFLTFPFTSADAATPFLGGPKFGRWRSLGGEHSLRGPRQYGSIMWDELRVYKEMEEMVTGKWRNHFRKNPIKLERRK